jgi:imidazolonepropionase-like amidohydrolase
MKVWLMPVQRLTFLLAMLPLTAGAQAQVGDTLLFQNIRVFDGTRTLDRASVLVASGRIVSVGADVRAPGAAEVIDGSGKTLLPGLIDVHVHAFGAALSQALVFGVTTVLDMFTAPQAAAGWQLEQERGGGLERADIFSAGILVTAPGGHGTEYGMPIPTISRPESAQAFVDARINEGSDYIKIVYDDGASYGLSFPTLDRETLTAVIAAAHERSMRAVVHVSTLEAAREALAAGADGLAHVFADALPDAQICSLAAERRAFVIPTLTVLESVTGVADGAWLQIPRLRPTWRPNRSYQPTFGRRGT